MKFVKNNILIIFISLCSILVLVKGIDLTQEQRDEATPYLKLSRLPYCQTSKISSSKCSVCSVLDDMEYKVSMVQSKTIDGLRMTMVISQSETETVVTFGGVKSTQMQKVQSMYMQRRIKVRQLGNIAIEPLLWKIYSKFRNILHKEIKNAKSNVIFAGHSLGGNIATLAAIDIKVNKIGNESTTYALYTFGALKMGPRKLWHGISKMMKRKILRVRKKKDLVTIMPRCVLDGKKFKCFPKRSELVKAYPQYKNHYKKIKGEKFGIIKRSVIKKNNLMKQYKKEIAQKKKIEKQLKEKPNNKKLRKKLNRIKKKIRKNRINMKKLKNQRKKNNTKAKKQKNVIKRTIRKFNKKEKKIANIIKNKKKRLNKLMKKKMTKARKKLVKKIKKQIKRYKKMKKAKKKKGKIKRKKSKMVRKPTKKIKKRKIRKQRKNHRKQKRKQKKQNRKNKRKQKRKQKKGKGSKAKKQSKIKKFFKRLLGKNKKRKGKKNKRRFLFFIQRKRNIALNKSNKCINRGKYIECHYRPKTHSTFWNLKIENCK